ncbi:hypothetical protein JTE90_028786 [Oedothorax gibbosus]|uniref:Uncharacterized protein n=1 Tax=Oedothorax gibbosus TaxID=931172 RepID=A0AAV6VY56_9ARAC|nr:hypothetical protein JTE90_028786 [Oedothorax gibbosus]
MASLLAKCILMEVISAKGHLDLGLNHGQRALYLICLLPDSELRPYFNQFFENSAAFLSQSFFLRLESEKNAGKILIFVNFSRPCGWPRESVFSAGYHCTVGMPSA